MKTSVEFHFDFGSPNAYLSHRIIPAIEARTGVNFIYVPVLLGGVFKATNNVSPMVALQGIRNKAEYNALETQRFLRRNGITDFKRNPFFPVNTLLIMRGAIAAQQIGAGSQYINDVFRCMWADSINMGDPDEIVAALNEATYDIRQVLAATASPDLKVQLIDNTNRSVERGNFGSPTFFVGDEMFFGKDKLDDVERLLIEIGNAKPVSA